MLLAASILTHAHRNRALITIPMSLLLVSSVINPYAYHSFLKTHWPTSPITFSIHFIAKPIIMLSPLTSYRIYPLNPSCPHPSPIPFITHLLPIFLTYTKSYVYMVILHSSFTLLIPIFSIYHHAPSITPHSPCTHHLPCSPPISSSSLTTPSYPFLSPPSNHPSHLTDSQFSPFHSS